MAAETTMTHCNIEPGPLGSAQPWSKLRNMLNPVPATPRTVLVRVRKSCIARPARVGGLVRECAMGGSGGSAANGPRAAGFCALAARAVDGAAVTGGPAGRTLAWVLSD